MPCHSPPVSQRFVATDWQIPTGKKQKQKTRTLPQQSFEMNIYIHTILYHTKISK